MIYSGACLDRLHPRGRPCRSIAGAHPLQGSEARERIGAILGCGGPVRYRYSLPTCKLGVVPLSFIDENGNTPDAYTREAAFEEDAHVFRFQPAPPMTEEEVADLKERWKEAMFQRPASYMLISHELLQDAQIPHLQEYLEGTWIPPEIPIITPTLRSKLRYRWANFRYALAHRLYRMLTGEDVPEESRDWE